jgi:hypothetical protein
VTAATSFEQHLRAALELRSEAVGLISTRFGLASGLKSGQLDLSHQGIDDALAAALGVTVIARAKAMVA